MRVLRAQKIQKGEMRYHETKRYTLIRFLLVFIIFIGYGVFLSLHYGIEQGFFITTLTWSFFVLCTPIADAGFLIDFPIRLVTRIRMVFSEILVWGIAIGINIFALIATPEVYESNRLLMIFKHILETPFPLWSIIIISALGTFLSIQFGDELLDTMHHSQRHHYHKHKKKHQFIVMLFLFVLILGIYSFIITQTGVEITTIL